MISEEELYEDLQYIRSITGVLGTVLTISKHSVLYSLTIATGVSHSCLLEDMPYITVCGIHPLYSKYMDLGEDTKCKHLTYTTNRPIRVLDLHKYSLLYNSRLYRSLLHRTDEIDGVLCRSWCNGPLELILYKDTDKILELTDTEQMDYSTYESLDEWTDSIREEEALNFYSLVVQTGTVSL